MKTLQILYIALVTLAVLLTGAIAFEKYYQPQSVDGVLAFAKKNIRTIELTFVVLLLLVLGMTMYKVYGKQSFSPMTAGAGGRYRLY